MSVEILKNDSKVISTLAEISENQARNGLLGSVGLRTDDHDCTLEIRYDMYEQEGNEELCLLVNFVSESDEVDEESFRWEQIADTINEEIDKHSDAWSEDAQSSAEEVYGVCLLHNGIQIY